jgi:tripartite-type tricarboxylate transporter receptor subunit TctC
MVKALKTAARRPTLAYIASWFMACAWILVMPGPGLAQAYPDGKPIKFISGAGPGSASDIIARAVAEAFRSELGVPVIVPLATFHFAWTSSETLP